MSETDYKELEELAQKGRWLVISTVAASGAGHVGGPFSAMDLMVALYFRVMKVRPIYSFEGSFCDWPIHRDGIAGLFTG